MTKKNQIMIFKLYQMGQNVKIVSSLQDAILCVKNNAKIWMIAFGDKCWYPKRRGELWQEGDLGRKHEERFLQLSTAYKNETDMNAVYFIYLDSQDVIERILSEAEFVAKNQ